MSKFRTELFIARRISSPEGGRKNVMVRIATATVAVGMAVMIVALAVIGGFRTEVTEKLVGFGAHVRITSLNGGNSFETAPIRVDSALMDTIRALPRFKSITTYAQKGGIIKTAEAMQGVIIKGVPAEYDFGFMAEGLQEGALPQVGDAERKKELLISRTLSDLLYLGVGDRVEVLFMSESRHVHRDLFKISGIYATGMDEVDKTMTFTDIRNIQRLNNWSADMVSGYEVMTTDFARLNEFTEDGYAAVFRQAEDFEDLLRVDDIVSLNNNTFDWLNAHNMNALVIIIIMTVVALLNMISALLIILLEKTSMIGVLKALGMTNRSVQKVFIMRSLRIVLAGMIYGNAVGIGIALLQKITGFVKLNSAGYIISQVPIEFGWWLLWLNIAIPIVMIALLAIPARVVTRIKPDKTIRYQ